MSKCCGERTKEVITINKINDKGGLSWFLSKIGKIKMVVAGVEYKFNEKNPTQAPSGLRKALFLQRVDEPIKETKAKVVQNDVSNVDKVIVAKEDSSELI
jgi:hypothetical protein